MSLSLLPVLALAGCGVGGFDLTLVEELRVVAIEAEPPEAQPGERVGITLHVANPAGFDVEVMFWTCLLIDDACAEAELAGELEEWVTLGNLVDGEVVVAREVPGELAEYLPEDETLPVAVLALACMKGRCPIFAEVREGMDQRGVPGDVAGDLADPESLLADLPMEVVALARRIYPITRRDPTGRNDNPESEARFTEALADPMVLPRGASVDMGFWAADPDGETIYAFPLTTAGSFDSRKVKVEDDQVRLWLETPEQPVEGELWVTFDDRDGGLDVFHRAFVVE